MECVAAAEDRRPISRSTMFYSEPGSVVNMLGRDDFINMHFVPVVLAGESAPAFVDVGADIGSYSLIASDIAGVSVQSLEPVPATYAGRHRCRTSSPGGTPRPAPGGIMRLVMALPLFALAAGPVAAVEWPQRDMMAVRELQGAEDQLLCEMQVRPRRDERRLGLVLTEPVRGVPLRIAYASADPRVGQARRVVISIDGAEIVAFAPRPSPPDGAGEEVATAIWNWVEVARVWAALEAAAPKAMLLRVSTAETSEEMSAKGLRAALYDFTECRLRHSEQTRLR